MITLLKNKFQNQTVRQSSMLFLAKIFVTGLSFISLLILPKGMGNIQYGIYALALSVCSFLAIFFEFGYFSSISRLLALNKDSDVEKRILGASILVLAFISMAFMGLIFELSFFIDSIFDDRISHILFPLSIVSFSYIVPFYLNLILVGINKIELLSYSSLGQGVLNVGAIVVLYFTDNLKPVYVLYSFCLSTLVLLGWVFYKIKPSFSGVAEEIKKIKVENKSYGIHVYLGRVLDVSAYQLDKIFIGYFVSASGVGIYSLANSMSSPINLFSSSIASSKYKQFSDGTPIGSHLLKYNYLIIVGMVLLVNILGFCIVKFYLGQTYSEVLNVLYIMSLAVGFQGGYQLFNQWLHANGYGKELKKMSYIMTIVSLVTNVVLIPWWGIIGAAIASAIATFTYFVMSILKYKQFDTQ